MSTYMQPIALEGKTQKEKVKEFTAKLEEGVRDMFTSEQFTRYLDTLAKFHNYSMNNCIAIAMQMPDATFVHGYKAWQKDFDRTVKKGEKGIKIFAPTPYKVTYEVERIDSNGNKVKEKETRTYMGFKITHVFDISQTEGKEFPTICHSLKADVKQFDKLYSALEKVSPVPATIEKIEGRAKGYFSPSEQRIVIREGESELQIIKTFLHEIAHAVLEDHQKEGSRRLHEVEAESVAYVVSQYLGLDTTSYSFEYVASWSRDRTLPELKGSLSLIHDTASMLIDKIEANLAEGEETAETTAAEQASTNKVFVKLPVDQQTAVAKTVGSTLQTVCDLDLKTYGHVTQDTLEALQTQGYTLDDKGVVCPA